MDTIDDAHENKILCCQCRTLIAPNTVNMCVACVRKEVDITEGIPKQSIMYMCKGCDRYLSPPDQWVVCATESRELLSLCLKKLKGLNRVRLVEAGFEWTEPHSRRIRVKLTIQKEVMAGAVLEQKFLVEFLVHTQMCLDCHRSEAKDFWRAMVQVRQKVAHKKTFYYLEQLILRHRAHHAAVGIKPNHDGLDFYYDQKQDARKMVDFLLGIVPCRYQTAQQLISHDTHSNTYNYKNTFSVEIVPICKNDVVCLTAKLAQSLSGISQLCICLQVSEQIHLIDPHTAQSVALSATVFWRDPFSTICGHKQLQQYVVMDIEIIPDASRKAFAAHRSFSNKHVLASVWVIRTSELGIADQQHCNTHLGHILKIGDIVLGFDLANSNVNDSNFDKLKSKSKAIPDVIIVKKYFADKAVRNRRRKWKLKHLHDEMEASGDKMERDYTDFLEDLEEDATYRQNVNIYLDKSKMAVDTDDTDDEDIPKVTLQEMMDDLHIDEDEDNDEEKHDSMVE